MLREPLSSTLSSLPEHFHAERAELLGLLRSRGILYRSPTQPILSRDGTSSRWMLDSLSVTLAPRGAELAGRLLLALLERFEGRQLATYGLTAVPILQSVVLQSGGRYHGLLVRKERKAHGSLKLIEGPLDPDEPTILIDDSISSGTCMEAGTARLEEAGLRVEGGVALVRFGWYGGYALMQERGYRIESVYDIWDDFIQHMEDEAKPLANPSKHFPDFAWSEQSAPEGLHPSHLARAVIDEYLASGRLLIAPQRLDREYDSGGGVWVSLRARANVHLRHARDGFWHFPGEAKGTPAEDIVMASLRTAAQLPAGAEGQKALAESAIGVTFFPALERCAVGQLDNDRYGIVVRSLERPSWMGGALPRMPGIGNEWEQFYHACRKNGRLLSFEPYEIFRHDVSKTVEPDAEWQPTGVPVVEGLPWHADESICGCIATHAREIALAYLRGREVKPETLPGDAVPEQLDSVYVTVFIDGRIRGCMGSVVGDLDADIRSLTRAALADDRFEGASEIDDPARVAVSVSLLYNPLVLGHFTTEEVVARVQHGRQALMAYQGERIGLLLPMVASMFNYDRVGYAEAVLAKAGIEAPPFNWCRFDSVTWLADTRGARLLYGGFPVEEPPDASAPEMFARLAALNARYLVQHQRPDGILYLRYEPFQNRLYEGVEVPRLAHAAWVMARAARLLGGAELSLASDRAIEHLLGLLRDEAGGCWLAAHDGADASVAEVSFLLLALLELDATDPRRAHAPRLAETLWRSIDQHGRIKTHRPPTDSHDVYQDYFPAQVLLALAASERCVAPDAERLQRTLRFYRHRFRYRRHFGQVSWLMQACARWWHVTGDASLAEFVFEIGDWILGYQQEKTGGFINDHQPDAPGFLTAVYLEGVGAALNLASALGDLTRRDKYLDSVTRGFRFLERLTIQARDASVLPNPELATGGLRQSVHRSEVRIDFVQHSLSALLELHPYAAPETV